PKRPTNTDPAFSTITSENVLFHIASILPVAQLNKYHGSLFVFNSHRQIKRFIADNSDQYRVWPSAWKFAQRQYLHFYLFNDLLHNYFKQHRTIPHLSCRAFLLEWARAFFAKHADGKVAVTVQIRNNKTVCPTRNLRTDCWLDFFHHCETK